MGKCVRCGIEDSYTLFDPNGLCRTCAQLLNITDCCECTEDKKSSSHHSKVDRPDKGRSFLQVLNDYVVIDVETSGLSPTDCEIIEFAAALVINGQVEETFSSLANPGFEISSRITAVTGITNEMLASAPPVSQVLKSFLDFIGDYTLVGHNVSFDVNFIYDSAMRHFNHGLSNNFVDTCRIARHSLKSLANHKLCTLAKYYCIENPNAHRALSDVLCTQQLYEILKNFVLYGIAMPESAVFGGYTPERIYESICQIVDDTDNVELKYNKSTVSIFMYGNLAFSIRINSRTQCLDCKVPAAKDFVGKCEEITFSSNAVHVSIAGTKESCPVVEDLIQAVYENRRSIVTGESFGCCNDFVRCSDAGQCLHQNDTEYLGCMYRKNLEAGRIFYGKNKNI